MTKYMLDRTPIRSARAKIRRAFRRENKGERLGGNHRREIGLFCESEPYARETLSREKRA